MRPRVLRRGALAVGGMVLGLLLGEAGLRLAGVAPPRPRAGVGEHPDRESRHFEKDPETGWRMRPSQRFRWTTDGREVIYAADSRGRRTARAPAPPRSERHLLAAGDSFLWGTGVDFEETLGARLAAELGGWRCTVLAMPGFGVDQIWRSVRQALAEGPADLVLVGLYPEDFERSFLGYKVAEGFNKPAFRLSDGELVPRTAADNPAAPWRWLESHSHVYQALREGLADLGRRHGIGPWWGLNAALLEALIEDTEKAGVPLVFVYVPARAWIGFPALRAWTRARGCAFFDATELVPAPPAGTYYPEDSHWTAAGHAWFAARLLEWLHARGLVPEAP